jgi:hypothetical protein
MFPARTDEAAHAAAAIAEPFVDVRQVRVGARHPWCATLARFQRAEGHGRRAADPNFFYAGHPTPHVRRFLSPASRIFGGPVWLFQAT